ncbi:M48 family metallopeptidase [Dongshaea marina]|uniref:M48 family metallopeptidase n=1 Tax=Dongshaea marina TaxID=2047966 RepID=UPI0018FF97C4|nr:M48 family metallopeptidase [Dongshaea marina]
MNRLWIYYLLGAWLLLGCSTVPITGRQQMTLLPESTMLATSFQQYDQFLQENPVSHNRSQAQRVKRVGTRIQHAVERYFAQRGMSQRLANYAWEFNLVQSKEINAWCMPGGKVVVYSGILPVTKDETGLAVVMGHEVAHAIARHGNERMSQALLAQQGSIALASAMQNYPQDTQQLWMSVYGMGAQFGLLLPYSRLQEHEADRLGLIFMAMAGYDPRQAPAFWERMAAQKKGTQPPSF